MLASWAGTIPDGTVWGATPGEVEVVSRSIFIPEGARLDIQPGAMIKFVRGARMEVDGTVVATGTSPDPIVLTSIKDDSIGGDTNGDGSQSTPGPGDWHSVRLLSGDTADVVLSHVTVRYAAEFRVDSGRLDMSFSNVEDIASDGLVTGSSGSPNLTLTDVTITNVGRNGVWVDSGNATLNSTNLTIQDVGGTHIVSDNAGLWTSVGTTLGGTGVRAIKFEGGTIDRDREWNDNPPYYLSGMVTVAAEGSLTIAPGSVIKADNQGELNVTGVLRAEATPEEHIIFTSIHDDEAGGDTNGNNDSTIPIAGDWRRIFVSGSDASASLTHVEVRYAGNRYALPIHVTGGRLDLSNSLVSDISGDGLRVTGNAILTNNRIQNVTGFGLSLTGRDSVVTMTDSLIENAAKGAYRVEPQVDLAANGTRSFLSGRDNAIVVAGGSIDENIVWQDELTYLVTGSLYVGASLQLAPGTIVKMNAGPWNKLSIDGALIAHGTASTPIYITSSKDDSVGGDSNGDGGSTTPADADWRHITGLGSIQMDYVHVRYAGSLGSAAVDVGGTFSLANGKISDAANAGVAVSSRAISVDLTGTKIQDVGGAGVDAQSASPTAAMNLSHMTIENTSGPPIRLNQGADFDVAGSTFSNTASSGAIVVQGSRVLNVGGFSGRRTWSGSHTYRIDGNLMVGNEGELVIGPGAVLKFGKYFGLVNDGTVTAVGTPDEPIVFTSIQDDVGGDSNGDGDVTGPQAGDWFNIWHRDGFLTTNDRAVSTFDHVEVRYAGIEVGNRFTPAILIDGGTHRLTNARIRDGADAGMRMRWSDNSDVKVERVLVQNVAAEAFSLGSQGGGGNVELKDIMIKDIGGDALIIGPRKLRYSLSNPTLQNVRGLNGTRVLGNEVRDDLVLGYLPLVSLDGSLIIEEGGSLTILPGTTVKVDRSPHAQIWAKKGPVLVDGTADEPILFTSSLDDSAIGDTNGDQFASIPGRGDWVGLRISHSPSSLEYVEVRYAGASGSGLAIAGSDHSYSNLMIHDVSGDAVSSSARNTSITNSLLYNFDQAGVSFGRGSDTASLLNNTVDGGKWGVRIQDRVTATIANNIFSGAADAGIEIAAQPVHVDSRHNNYFNPHAVDSAFDDLSPRSNRIDRTGDISSDPLYTSAVAGSFELRSGSPAIDAADGSLAPPIDLLGRERIDDPLSPNLGIGSSQIVDIGALEHDRWVSQIISPMRSGEILAGDTLRFRGVGSAAPDPVTFEWDFQDGLGSTAKSPDLVTFRNAGKKEISFGVTSGDGVPDPTPDTLNLRVVPQAGTYPDFSAAEFTAETDLIFGHHNRVHYVVHNIGDATPADASWIDAVYLSSDPFLDRGDVPVGHTAVSQAVPSGESYAGEIDILLSGEHIELGANYLILSVDDQWAILEHHQLNNEFALSTDVAIPLLEDGVPTAVSFEEDETGHFYRIEVPSGRNLSVMLDDLDNEGANELYLRHGSLPTRGEFDYRFNALDSADQRILVPAALPGTWYVLTFGSKVPPGGDYVVQADLSVVSLGSVTPDHHGSNADATLTLQGAGFIIPMTVDLVAEDGTVYSVSDTMVDSFTRATVTLSAGDLPPGVYTIRATRGDGHVAELVKGFESLSGGKAQLETNLISPPVVGFNRPATVYLEYGNIGDVAMPAPVLTVRAEANGKESGLLTLDSTRRIAGSWTTAELPQGFSTSITVLASGQTAGLLQPGESFTLPIYYAGWRQPGPDAELEWRIEVMAQEAPIDWAMLKHDARPGHMSEEAWHVVWANFVEQAGSTTADFVAMINNNAAYLDRLGQRVVDLNSLIDFEIQQAGGSSPLRVISSAIDVAGTAPGKPLIFGRTFGNTIAQRHKLGPFGRGWSHIWETSLTEHPDGTVTVETPTSLTRVFQPDSRGGYLPAPGDTGALSKLNGGGFRIDEVDGHAIGFRLDGKLNFSQDASNNRITFVYEGGMLIRMEHSSGQNFELKYNSDHRIQRVIDDVGRETTFNYDSAGEHLLSVQYADGRRLRYSYASGDNLAVHHALTEVEFPDKTHQYFSYDANGRVTRISSDANAEAMSLTYDSTGKVTIVDSDDAATEYFFDHRGQLVKVRDPQGNSVSMVYDSNLNLTQFVDPSGRAFSFTYDAGDNLIESTNPLGQTTRLAYTDTFGRLSSLFDANGNTTRYEHDRNGNPVAMVDASGSVERFSYGSSGHVSGWTNHRGDAVRYLYDDQGRLTTKIYDDSSEAEYVYDERGNLISAANALGTIELTYDVRDYLTRITYPGGRFLQYTYDESGRRSSMEDQLGFETRYHYDELGRLAGLTDGSDDLVRYTYDELGQVVSEELGNGVHSVYAYDNTGQVSTLTTFAPDGSILSRFVYSYDRLGRRKSAETINGKWTYEYDAIGQLIHAVFQSSSPTIASQDLTYTYDAMGNRIQTVVNGEVVDYESNNLNQVTAAGDTTLVYDADGNLSSKVSPAGVTRFSYDDENQLIAISSQNGLWSYAYDALGNRTSTTTNGEVVHHVVDPFGLGSVIAEYDENGTIVANYAHGLRLISTSDQQGDTAFYSFDGAANQHGNVD